MAKFRSRTLARQRAFQILYGLEFNSVRTVDELRLAFERIPNEDSTEADSAEVTDFAWKLCAGVWANAQALDASIAKYSRNWRPERLGKVELTLLRLAFYEIGLNNDVPVKVVISEALDLASRFTHAQAKHFINGILDAAAVDACRE